MTLYKVGDKVRYQGREYEIIDLAPATYDIDSPERFLDDVSEDELEYVPEPGSVAEAEAEREKLTKTQRIERLEKVVGLLCDESQYDFVMNRRAHVDDIPRLQSKVAELNNLKNTVLELEKRLQDIEQEYANKAAKGNVKVQIAPEAKYVQDVAAKVFEHLKTRNMW